MKAAAVSRLVDMDRAVYGAVGRVVKGSVYAPVSKAMNEGMSWRVGPAVHEAVSQIAGRDVGDSTLLVQARRGE